MTVEWNRAYRKSSFSEKSEDKKRSEREPEQPKTHFGDPIERKQGDGAQSWVDDQRDAEKIRDEFDLLFTQTTLYARDCREDNKEKESSQKPTPEEFYDRIWKYHHGWNNDTSGRREQKDKIALTQALADEFPISKRETRSAIKLVLETNGRKFNRYGGLEALVLGAIAYVRDLEISSGNFSHMDYEQKIEARIIGSNKYNIMCNNLGVDGSKAHRQMKRVN